MDLVFISDPHDARIAAFRDVKERDLTGREGLFVAEGEVVLRVLSSEASQCQAVAVLIAEKRLESLRPILEAFGDDVPIYLAGQEVLDAIAGFHLHRGILALGRKPEAHSLDEVLAQLEAREDERQVLVAASGIGNHDNMGGIFRNAAAFGAGAVLMDSACCDPFYRKAIRVSVGAVLRTPMVTGLSAAQMVAGLQARGWEVLALTPSAEMILSDFIPGPRTVILLGSEGPGLSQAAIDTCTPIGIRMAGGFDSLNVATTSGIALHQLVTAKSG